MELLVYTVVGLAVTWGLYATYMLVVTRAAEGKSAAPLYTAFPDMRDRVGRVLVYCYGPHCRPCRPMSREVETLDEEGLPVYRLDVTAHPEITRTLGIRATPTLIVVEDGTVANMLLGVRMANEMRSLLRPGGGRMR